MLEAAIDVGSNTLRMLVARVQGGLSDCRYYREVTRLAGRFEPVAGLHPDSMERTLQALERFAGELSGLGVRGVRAVGTAALRQAANAATFLQTVETRTGLHIEIIDGAEEAALSCRGILSVLTPLPHRSLLFDIGGGSTEILLLSQEKIVLQTSLPLGVVRLFEQYATEAERRQRIDAELHALAAHRDWRRCFLTQGQVELVGTAGTVTTLAAMKLKMSEYVGARVNNLTLSRPWLLNLGARLAALTPAQRLQLPGLETGREEIIMPGLQLLDGLFELSGSSELRVADAGLLEGLLLE